jgi:hypothetical protein
MKRIIKKWLIVLISLFLLYSSNFVFGISWPTTGTYPQELSSDYGPRNIYHYFHYGLDFLGGPKVKAVEGGKITDIVKTGNSRRIEIEGEKSGKKVWYMHVNALPGIKKGDTVTEGQEIATYIVPDDSYPDHLDIRFPYGTFQSNPLRDLFSSLYTSNAPLIDYLKVKGSGIKEKDSKYYINKDAKEVTIESHIKTTTKDLDIVEFNFNPSISGFPIKFDYHNHSQWSSYNGYDLNDTMKCSSKCSKTTPADDYFCCIWDASNAKDGEYKLEVTAETVKNKKAEKEITVVIDRASPKIISINPQEDKIINKQELKNLEIYVEFEDPKQNNYASGIDINKCELLLDGSKVNANVTESKISYKTSDLQDGKHTVKVIIYDKAGNKEEKEWKFYVDTTPPQILITSPSEEEWLNKNTVNIKGKVEDPKKNDYASGIKSANFKIAGKSYELNEGDFNLLVNLKDGKYTAKAEAEDKAGNKNDAERSFYVDTTPPEINGSAQVLRDYTYIEIKIYDCRDKLIGQGERPVGYGEVNLSWTGSDNLCKEEDILFSYKLEGPSNKSHGWTPWTKEKQTSYSGLKSGFYKFYIKAKDKIGNIGETQVWFCVNKVKVGEENKKPPSCDTPDETQSPGTENEDISSYINVDFNSKLLVLNCGWADCMVKLLQSINESFNLRDPTAEIELFKKYPVLIIPTGALASLAYSSKFKELLEDYVKDGNTILCFAQQHSNDYKVLPGADKLETIGWQNDMSCWRDSSYITKLHPILASQYKSTKIDIPVDGYFTQWSNEAEVILSRENNKLPVLLIYKYQKGHILVTSSYIDWAYTHGQKSSDASNLFKDIISWAKDEDKKIQEVKPNQRVNIPIKIVNDTDTDIYKIKLTLKNPNREIIQEEEIEKFLKSKETTELNFNIKIPDIKGIYSISYGLIGTLSFIIKTKDAVEHIVLMNEKLEEIEKPKGFGLSIFSDKEVYYTGEEAKFDIIIQNFTDKPATITGHYNLPYHRISGSFTVWVKAEDKTTYTYTLLVKSVILDRLWINFYKDDKFFIAKVSRGIWVKSSILIVNIKTDKEDYSPEEEILFYIKLANKSPIKVIAPASIKIHSKEYLYHFTLAPHEIKEFCISFHLPEDISFGYYRGLIEVLGEKQYFRLCIIPLKIRPYIVKPSVIKTGTNSFNSTLTG